VTTSTDHTWQRLGNDVPALKSGAVHVWRLDLAAAAPAYEDSRRLLAEDEVAKAGRYRFEAPRQTYVAGRAALRRLLGRYLGAGPETLRFRYGEQGKPELEGGKLAFNVSHSGGWALIAVATRGRLGVDLERVRPVHDMDGIAQTCFSEAELVSYHATAPEERQRVFFDGWTRKEAFIKALGGGLAVPLKSFTVSLDGPAALIDAPAREDASGWSLQAISVTGGCPGAVAIDQPNVQIMAFDLST